MTQYAQRKKSIFSYKIQVSMALKCFRSSSTFDQNQIKIVEIKTSSTFRYFQSKIKKKSFTYYIKAQQNQNFYLLTFLNKLKKVFQIVLYFQQNQQNENLKNQYSFVYKNPQIKQNKNRKSELFKQNPQQQIITKYTVQLLMGGVCWSQAALHHNVHHLPNQVPTGNQYIMHQSHSIRFSQITVNRTNMSNTSASNNQYKFVMKIFNSSEINDTISVNLVILNENIQRLLTQNYQLKVQKKMIIDIFNKKLSTTLVQAKNEKSGLNFSIQVFSFRGYTSQVFKKCIYTLYIIKRKLIEIQSNQLYYHKLIDNFVYGCNPDKQALTFLYQRAETSLANIAQYRRLADWPWTMQQKLKIFTDILNGVYHLHKRRIYHRDIRPSNIFYIERLGRYVIGSFMKCIQLSNQDNLNNQHNRTVYGLEYMFKKGCDNHQVKKIGNYIQQEREYAPYSPKFLDYHGLHSILHILQTLEIINMEPHYKDKVILSVYNELHKIYDPAHNFQQIRQKILLIGQKHDIQHIKLSEDNQISTIVHKLASVTHKSTIQEFTFQIYDTLGYQKQFSNTTHQLIQKNNQQNKPLQNAYLLKNLGQFFQRNGAKGTQYYCNACLLFLKRTQLQLKLQNIEKAKQDYYQAEKCYIKFSQNFQSYSTYIQIHRIKALIKMQDRDIAKALQIIKQTFEYAAKRKISIQKQMTLLLAYAKIHLRGNPIQRQIGQEKLKNGLAICQNKGAFQNISSCNIHTSNFLYELGYLFHFKLRIMGMKDIRQSNVGSSQSLPFRRTFSGKGESLNLLKGTIKQLQINDYPKFKALTQSYLKSCLQIREKQKIQVIQLINVLRQLGSFYYDVQLYVEAKRTFQRCQILLKQIQKQVNSIILIKTLYSYGSTLYSMKQYDQAQKKYNRGFKQFQKISSDENQLLKFNILGNLGLTQMQLNKQQGQKKVLQAKNQIKRLKHEKFYDYEFLRMKYSQIKSSKKKKK